MVEAERAEWDHFLHLKEMYKKFQKDIRKPINRLDPELLLESRYEREEEQRCFPCSSS